MEMIGRVLASRYEILEKIGEGGMATVYKARCKLLNRFVAVKILKEEFAKDENFVARFRAEAQSAGALTHPNIVSVYDVGQEDDGKINYIVMELLDGITLKDYINKNGSLTSELTLKIAIQIASALDAAHKANIIHRDIKPQNIVLNKNMVAKVTDFGIAKILNTTTTGATITNFGTTVGSVHYISPEHAKGGFTDEKSDIYSLGVVMYEMATGRVPFDGDSPVTVALMQIQDEPVEPIQVNPTITMALNEIIKKAMSKNPSLRYQTANELLTDLSRALANPHAIVKRQESYIEAGETQVIPTFSDSTSTVSVPNLRTRQANRQNVSKNIVTSIEKNNMEDTDEDDKRPSITNARKVEVEDISNEIEEKIMQEKREKNANKKGNFFKKHKILVIIIAVVVILSIMTTVFVVSIKNKNKANSQGEITVPDLVGKKYEDFVEIYKNMGIELVQDSAEYSNDVEEGFVISQKPDAGTVTKNNKVYLTISKGKKMVEVTDVEGKDHKVAKYELEQSLGLVVEEVEEVSEKVSAGIVISQSIKAGESVATGSKITLKVSSGDGKKTVTMPNVLSKSEKEAKSTLEELGLTVKVEYSEDTNKTNGVVIAQNYPQNQSLKEGDLVTITVNKLQLSKNVNIDLNDYISEDDVDSKKGIDVKVTASVDGGVANTVFDKNITDISKSVSFTLNGYTSAILKLYIDGVYKKDIAVTF